MTDEEIVAALAEALCGKQWVRKVMGDGHTSLLQADEVDLATAALPVVRRVAEQRAADGARAAAMSLRAEGEFRAADRCDAIAAALTATPNHGRNAT